MNSLIRIVVLGILAIISAQCLSQSLIAKTGLNFSKILILSDGEEYLAKPEHEKRKVGFLIGATVEIPLSDVVSFETGLLISTKGLKWRKVETFQGKRYKEVYKMNLSYFDIPLTAKASFDHGRMKTLGIFGPYLGIGFQAKSIETRTIDGKIDKKDIELHTLGFNEDIHDLKRLDFGLNIGAGVEINSFQIVLQYGLGLANLSWGPREEWLMNNRVWGLSIGYRIGSRNLID